MIIFACSRLISSLFIVKWNKKEKPNIPFYKIRSRKPRSNRKLNEICGTSGGLSVLKATFLKALLQNILLCIFHFYLGHFVRCFDPTRRSSLPVVFHFPKGRTNAKERENPGDISLVGFRRKLPAANRFLSRAANYKSTSKRPLRE